MPGPEGVDEGILVAGPLRVPLSELVVRATRAGGPGGQHVNTSSTRIEVTFDVAGSPSLTDWQRTRLLERLGSQVRVVAADERSQSRNRSLALERLAGRLAAALVVERPRRATRPTRGSIQRRLDAKKRDAARKRQRRNDHDD